MALTCLTSHTFTIDDDTTITRTTHTLEVWVPADPDGFYTSGYWQIVDESYDLDYLQHQQKLYEVSRTTLDETIHEYLGTFSEVRVYSAPDLKILLERIDMDHQPPAPCNCQHDCCGHVISRDFRLLSITTTKTEPTLCLAMVHSEYSINV